jgi:hypothetical protein
VGVHSTAGGLGAVLSHNPAATARPYTVSRRCAIRIALFVALFASLLLANAAHARPTADWADVETWRGGGARSTESFEVAGPEWRVEWEASDDNPAQPGVLIITIRRANGEPVSTVTTRAGTDVSSVPAGPGRYYLEIVGPLQWTITVSERV